MIFFYADWKKRKKNNDNDNNNSTTEILEHEEYFYDTKKWTLLASSPMSNSKMKIGKRVRLPSFPL